MQLGATLHAAGQQAQALGAFEQALTHAPQDLNAASACAALLTELKRPAAAYRILMQLESQLLQDADGAANLAIAAEACGDLEKANTAYARALALNPQHLRSLTNVGVLAASLSQWDSAIGLAQKCVNLEPEEAQHHANLVEFLTGAQRYDEALAAIETALLLHPNEDDLRIRQVVVLAFKGDIERSNAAIALLSDLQRALLSDFLHRLNEAPVWGYQHVSRSTDMSWPDAFQIYMEQGFRDLALCDWRNDDAVRQALRHTLHGERASSGKKDLDFGSLHAPLHGLTLGLESDELTHLRLRAASALRTRLNTSLPKFSSYPAQQASTDSRIRIGLAVRSLHDERQLLALTQQLSLHDTQQYAIHIYAFTPQPDPLRAAALKLHAASVNELAHMSSPEAAARIRLDALDIYIEYAASPAWGRPDIAVMRVAPVQLQFPPRFDSLIPDVWDYRVTDAWMAMGHPSVNVTNAVLPQTAWLSTAEGHALLVELPRKDTGFPADATVLVTLAEPSSIDHCSFTLWMKILRSLPDSVLWLPRCGRASAHLVRQAQTLGVGAARLIFSTPMNRHDLLACMAHADLLLDTLAISDAEGIEDALWVGVPSMTCPGSSTASRWGGSILRSAGLGECIFESRVAYVAEVVSLARNPQSLAGLKQRLQLAKTIAPLFDLPSRVREVESAWMVMAERSCAGLPPVAFDVPHCISPVDAIK